MQSVERKTRMPLKNTALLIGGFLILLLIVYGGSLSNDFIGLDDPYVIYNNLAIREISPATIKHFFVTYDPELYTPLTFLTFQLNYLVGGLEPFVYHLTNLLLHTANALLVVWLLTLLIGNRTAATAAGLLFALHPVNTEVVVWATARKEVLSVFFFLLAFIAYLKSRSNKVYWLSVGLFLLALLSKVNVFVLPILLLLTDLLKNRPMDRRTVLDKIPYVILSIIFVVIGLLPKENILASTTLIEKVLMASKSTLFYLWKFLIPINLSAFYPHYGSISFSSPALLASVLGLFAILIIVTISLRWTRKIAFGFLFFFLAISPTFVHFNRNAGIVSNSATGIQFASDHYLYLPMIGLLYLVATTLVWIWNRPGRLPVVQRTQLTIALSICAVFIAFGSLSHAQAALWQNSETLFSHTLVLYPYSTASRVSLSVIFRKTGRFNEERKILEDGLRFGTNSKILTGLGSIAARNSDFSEANRYYEEAIRIDPLNSEPYFGQGVILSQQGKLEEAYAAYRKAIALDPVYVAAYNNVGSLKLEEGKEKEAEENFMKAISINRSFLEGHFNLGALYRKQKRFSEARSEFEIAIQLDPTLLDARLELVQLYLQEGKNTRAFEQVKAVLSRDPQNEMAKALVKEMMKLGVIGSK